MVTCKEAKDLRSGIDVEGRIEAKGEARTVNTKYGETQVCDSYLVDETGRIKLTLWGEDVEKVKVGDKVSIKNAYTSTFRNEVQLNIPKKNEKLKIIKPVLPLEKSPPPDKPPSKGNDETYKPREDVEYLKKRIEELDKYLLDLLPSRSPSKNAKRLPDKKSVENEKSDLRERDLRGMDLTNAKLSDAKMANADLRRADLSRADLRRADLYGATLCDAKLTNAKLSGADLSHADLTNVDLRRVDLTKTKMEKTEFGYKKTGSIYKGRSSIGKAGGTVPINFHDRTNEY